MSELFNISVVGNGLTGYPTDIAFLFLRRGNEEPICAIRKFPFTGPWGCAGRTDSNLIESQPIPDKIDTVYLSAREGKFYSLEENVDIEKVLKIREDYLKNYSEEDLNFIVGLAPYGRVALWVYYSKKQYLVEWFKGEEIEVDMEDFFPNNPNISLNMLCEHYINEEIETIAKENQQQLDLKRIDSIMRQYNYLYKILFSHEEGQGEMEGAEKYELTTVKDSLLDGTFDCLNDGRLLSYHMSGIVKKVAVVWKKGKALYSCYIFFDENEIIPIFERFYGVHPETKADFIIRMDVEKGEYALALFRQGLKEPVTIPEEAFQVIVFKDKFECYRSANYNQPKGAWIW